MAWEAQLQVPDSDIKVEVRRGGQWVHVRPEELK